MPALKDAVLAGRADSGNPCLSNDECAAFLGLLKEYTKRHIYSHASVEKVELEGHRIIPYLLSAFWTALEASDNGQASKLDRFVIKRISPNYMRAYQNTLNSFPSWYARLQVCCDMVCGMTDSFALSMAGEFKSLGVSGDPG